MRVSLGLVLFSVLAVGCARSGNVAMHHPEEPGTHVISGHGAISVVKNDGKSSRACTRLIPGKNKRGAARAGDAGSRLDVLLFRLCEARSNGDLSAEQYAASVQSIVKTMEQVATQPRIAPRPRRRFDMDGHRRWRRRGHSGGPPESAPEPEPKKDERK